MSSTESGASRASLTDRDASSSSPHPQPNALYVLHCRSGNLSSQAQTVSAKLDLSAVESINGNILVWRTAGLLITSP